MDAFNFYYGATKSTEYKGLNLYNMCKHLLPKNNIINIKYFTALVSARKNDPNQPVRQKVFLRALETIPA